MDDNHLLEPTTRALVDSTSLQDLPGLLRIAAASGWRIAQFTVSTSVRTTAEMVKAAATGRSPVRVLQDATAELVSMAAQLIGRPGTNDKHAEPSPTRTGGMSREELRARGAELLYRSADVGFAEDTHPAFERILDQLSPDEGRILRLLALEGAQPSVDVRTSRPLGVGSELIAGGLSLIGLQAGVRRLERTNAYLNNLERLGLIWFSREQLDPKRYQVVEVQPDVLDAAKEAGRSSKTVRRSIHLTPFGDDFCATCLPIDPSTDA